MQVSVENAPRAPVSGFLPRSAFWLRLFCTRHPLLLSPRRIAEAILGLTRSATQRQVIEAYRSSSSARKDQAEATKEWMFWAPV